MIKYNPLDMIGLSFGDLTVIKIVPHPEHLKPRLTTYYYCECHCGMTNCYKYSICRRDQLQTGNTKSCRANKKALQVVEDIKKSSFNAIYSKGRYNDADLTIEQFINLAKSNCFYCSIEPYKKFNDFFKNEGTEFSKTNGDIFWNGLDRIDSNLNHSLLNVVSCCQICNMFKLDRSYMDVYDHIKILDSQFKPIFANELSLVKEKIKLLEQGFGCLNPKGKTSLSKLYPATYGQKAGPVLTCRISIFFNTIKNKNIECDLSVIDVAELKLANCIYCNSSPNLITGKFNGIDRYINSNQDGKIGYLNNNCVSACHYCNSAKRQLSIDDFRSWIIRIKSNLNNLPESKEKLDDFLNSRVI